MALARIITRSLACSRELALDLLARGYAVEIVSPDKVPDNIADLELRVDNGPGDQLIANVEAHDGGRTASLEFVHHLKAPMVNFMRRIPDPGDTGHFSGKPISSNAVPSIERTELPAEAPQPAPRAVSLEEFSPIANSILESTSQSTLESISTKAHAMLRRRFYRRHRCNPQVILRSMMQRFPAQLGASQ